MQKLNKILLKLATVSAAFIAVILVLGEEVNAQKTTSLSVAPAIIEAVALPATKTTQEIAITNTSVNAVPISISFRGITLDDEVLAEADTSRFDISQWMSAEEDIVVINADETLTIPIQIAVPKDVIPGGHYGGVAFRALALEGSQTLTNESLPEISVPILLTAPGPQKENVSIVRTDIFPSLRFSDTLDVNFEVVNRGSTHSIITPEVVISANNQEVKREKLQASVILPGSKKTLQRTISDLSAGSYTARVELVYGSPLKELSSTEEKLYILPAVWKLLVVSMAGLSGCYVFTHRRNLQKAIGALVK